MIIHKWEISVRDPPNGTPDYWTGTVCVQISKVLSGIDYSIAHQNGSPVI